MAKAYFEVKSYRVRLGNGITDKVRFMGSLNCLDAPENWVYQQTIFFLSDDLNLPTPEYYPAAKAGAMYRPIAQMGLFLDLLRNEKPVFAFMDDTAPEGNFLATYPEAVGEGE
jgi:hypothetical protein